MKTQRGLLALGGALLLAASAAQAASNSALSDQPIQPDYEGYVRTAPLFEAGQPFLDTGNIDPGFELSSGAVWQPQFLVWGDFRSAYQDFDSGPSHTREWANRLNLFAQLKLTGTERVLISLRPLDYGGRFSGHQYQPSDNSVNEINGRIRSFYFEGDFGEIFANLDPDDTRRLDWGFSIGRQPLFIQEGMLINDTIDSLGIVRNSITLPGVSNLRVTGLVGWNEVNRDDNREDDQARLWGLFSEMDFACCTVNADLAYVDSGARTGGDGYYLGLSSVQRIGHLNSAFRLLHSKALDVETAAVSSGTLLFAETSWSPTGTHNNLYITGFVGINQYASAARDVSSGGPLGRTGILYAAVGLGQYGAALSNRADDAYGFGLGYQMFFSGNRRQLIVELGGREETDGPDTGAAALGLRYQQAFGRHTILVLDGFVNDTAGFGGGGGRVELRWKF